MFKKATIGVKLAFSFGAMLVLVLILGLTSIKINMNLGSELNNAITVTAKKQMLAGQILASAAEMTALERGVASSALLQQIDKGKAFQQQYSDAERRVRECLSEFEALPSTEETRAQLGALDREEDAL